MATILRKANGQAQPRARLAGRWLPHSLARRPLPEALDSVTRAVRGVFDEIFRV